MDECRKKPVLSTKMAVFVDGEAGLSTIMAIYVDKWQKKRHPSTYRPDFMDEATGSSMKTALYVDDSGPKAGMICLKIIFN